MKCLRHISGLVVAGVIVFGLTACPKTPPKSASSNPMPSPTPLTDATPVEATPSPTRSSSPTPEPAPTALPEAFVPRRSFDTAKLFNGLKITSHLESLPGGIAPLERKLDESFSVDISLKVKVPAPMSTAADFVVANPNITKALPMLETLLVNSRVSPYYHAIYALKVKSLQQDLRNLNEILSRHNFFDCGTILELTNPTTQRKALLIQADMDVVTDGSDADRFLEVDGSSIFYQPFTSYRWAKKTATPSQFLASRQAALAAAEAELARPGVAAERARTLRSTIASSKLDIVDLQTFSFLIAKADPFIVLPGFMLRDKTLPFCPRIGDYAAVIFQDKIYPAIFGDVGPSVKMGEASLRMSTTLNVKSSANIRPTNNLDVSYLIFPKSAETEATPPDYEKWRTRCEELLAELGATHLTLERWENILPPLPTPTPSPSPSDSTLAIPVPKALETTVPNPSP